MMKNTRTLMVAIFTAMLAQSYAQHNSTAYFMNYVPQSSFMNPATIPVCNFYVSFPNLSFEIKNNAISANDIYYYRPDLSKYITPFDSMATSVEQQKFLNAFKPVNNLGADFHFNAFGLGFRANKSFITFQLTQRSNTDIEYPASLPKFVIEADDETREINVQGITFQQTIFQEVSLGFARKVDNILTYGIRGKFIMGQANFQVSRLDLEGNEDYVSTAMDIKSSTPASMFQVYTSNNEFDSVSFMDMENANASDFFKPAGNPGFAFDLGVSYNLNERVTFSASALDLGMIRWRNNIFTLSQEATFNFSDIADSLDFDNVFDLMDSVFNSFSLGENNNPYTTMLSAKFLFGASFNVTRKFNLGALSYNQVYHSRIYPRVTLSANFRPFSWLSTSFSYSLLNKEHYNMGFGFSFKPGPFHVYLIGDTYPIKFVKDDNIPVPTYMKGFRMHFGFNYVIGTKKILKAQKDTPFLVE